MRVVTIGVEIGGDDPSQAKRACQEARSKGYRVMEYTDLGQAAHDLKTGVIQALVAPGDTKEAARAVLQIVKPPEIRRLKGDKYSRSLLLTPIALVLPNARLGHFVLCDAGAQTNVTSQDLYLNLLLGVQYAWHRLEKSKPRVALLHIGEEEHKLRPIDHEFLSFARRGAELGYFTLFGNGIAEAGHVMNGEVDVVVCSGWDGNVALKWCEAGLKLFIKTVKTRLRSWPLRLLGFICLILGLPALLLALPILRPVVRHFQPKRYAGGLVAGLGKTLLICHGSSTWRDILEAIKRAHDMEHLHVATAMRNVVFNERLPRQLPEWLSVPDRSPTT